MNWTAVIIVVAACWAIVQITRGVKNTNKKENTLVSELQAEHEQMKTELSAMKERLIVLEKIVTDEKYQLNKEFDSL